MTLVFDMSKKLDIHHYYQIPEHFHHPSKVIPSPFSSHSPFSCPHFMAHINWLPVCVISLLWTSHVSELKQYLTFYDWLLSLRLMFSRFIWIIAYIWVSFIFIFEWYSNAWDTWWVYSFTKETDLSPNKFFYDPSLSAW